MRCKNEKKKTVYFLLVCSIALLLLTSCSKKSFSESKDYSQFKDKWSDIIETYSSAVAEFDGTFNSVDLTGVNAKISSAGSILDEASKDYDVAIEAKLIQFMKKEMDFTTNTLKILVQAYSTKDISKIKEAQKAQLELLKKKQTDLKEFSISEIAYLKTNLGYDLNAVLEATNAKIESTEKSIKEDESTFSFQLNIAETQIKCYTPEHCFFETISGTAENKGEKSLKGPILKFSLLDKTTKQSLFNASETLAFGIGVNIEAYEIKTFEAKSVFLTDKVPAGEYILKVTLNEILSDNDVVSVEKNVSVRNP